MNEAIDVVITWVDSSDPIWFKERNKYLGQTDDNSFSGGLNRYQSNDLLQYLFRGIELFMPWVNKVHFVTYGHIPSWLNTKCEKINIVKHQSFIPAEYLPTFNSNTILLNLHRIEDLSDRFILFNDDMFVIKSCSKKVFFKKGLPTDMAIQEPIVAPNADPFWDMMVNNAMLVNKNCNKRKAITRKPFNWYNPKYGIKKCLKNFFCLPYKNFVGFYDSHLPNSYLKQSFLDFWDKNGDYCDKTCRNKFRTCDDITEWAIKYSQLANNHFYPINKDKLGLYTSLKDNSSLKFIINDKHYKLVCFNDECDEEKKAVIKRYFDSIFPNKSIYEK